MRYFIPVLLCLLVARCGSSPRADTSFLFAVVPGLPADFANDASSRAGPAASLSALFETADQLPGMAERPDFIVIAGVSRGEVPPGARDSAVARGVSALQRSTIRRVFLIPIGATRRDTGVWNAVAGRAAYAGVALKDLTSCYEADTLRDEACSIDVERTRIRIVGFPSLGLSVDTAISRRVTRWIGVLDTLVTHAGLIGRSVVVVTDVPDPGLWESAGIAPTAVARFNAMVTTRVAALVGVRRRSPVQYRAQDRIVQTPTLAATTANDTVLGFTLLRAMDHSVTPHEFRRRGPVLAFTTVASPADVSSERPGFLTRGIGSLRELTQASDLLAFWAVIAIAAIVAFLTIVQLWEIPPVNAPAAATAQAAQPSPASSSGAPAVSSAMVLFRGNMARAVTAGLSGLLLVAFLDDFWKTAGFNAKALYLVVFVGLFFVVLAAAAALRAIGEGWRHAVVSPRLHPVDEPKLNLALVSARWVGRWLKWLIASALVAYDTFLAAFQGENQFQSRVWAKAILDHHRSMLTVAETLRSDIDRRIRAVPGIQALNPGPGDVRVNISLENNSHTGLYYVRWAPGSLQRAFGEKSVAYLAVATGQPLWWKQTYPHDTVTLVDNSSKQIASYRSELPQELLKLSGYFELRPARDYAAFFVIPFPFRSRGTQPLRRGGIHFSFASSDLINELIENLEFGALPGEPNYGCCQHLLDKAAPPGTADCDTAGRVCQKFVRLKNLEVGAAVEYSLAVFESLFATFDDDVYNEYRSRL